MAEALLHDDDLRRIAARGLAAEDVQRQLALLRNPPPYTRLERACTPGDGIRVPSAEEIAGALRLHAEAAEEGRFSTFIPASGAATRMFRALLAVHERDRDARRADLERRAAEGDADAREVLVFADGLHRFAFAEALRDAMRARGLELDAALREGRVGAILEHVLTARGLDYASLPKGLLLFHRYPGGPRTPLEEHLVEAASYARSREGIARLHVTVSPQHLAGFRALLDAVERGHEQRLGTRFEVTFSHQEPSTDTVAVDLAGNPFRDADGALLFRPGGHGALLGNLERTGADVVYVKNIDNVVPDHLKAPIVHWRKVLGGILVGLQAKAFAALARLEHDGGEDAIAGATRLLERDLDVAPPRDFAAWPLERRRGWATGKIDRPLRVCGMVRCAGDPGGGPFWVRSRSGEESRQIVETAQVDGNDPQQRALLGTSTHFNPVDLVCGLRDHRGHGYRLREHVDPDAVFISEKSFGGAKLRALEHPGLWNGSMADWNTVFVEVPPETFNPVKTVNDLLSPRHQ
ncbi:MAG: DUF4301 family protein [Thermodesulfobacteriota bacterium]